MISKQPISLGTVFVSIVIATVGSCERVSIEIETNISATENMTFAESMKYWLDKDEFKSCKVSDLEPLDTVWTLINRTQKEQVNLAPEELKGDELAQYAVEFHQNLDIELTPRDRDHVVMHLFKKAAAHESIIAISEIGASLLFCYQHVEQDLTRAQEWLERAVEHKDPYAMHALGRMHLARLTKQTDSERVGIDLIRQCAALKHKPCEDDLAKIKT